MTAWCTAISLQILAKHYKCAEAVQRYAARHINDLRQIKGMPSQE
jgi:hypothetical protein